ncbi:MAG: beta-galactosidase, partial [Planctomycetes bacterium]|nr:beta-galactosidase [Planctomycetota bacterium]
MKTTLDTRNGVPVLMIDGSAVAPMMVWGGSSAKLSRTATMMRARGFHIYTTPLDMPWPREGETRDFGKVDAEMEALLKNDPQALYMPRIWVEPPKWWKQAHLEEMPVWENGKSDEFISVTSERWLKEVGPHIDALVNHLEGRWDQHIFAYHPAALNSAEWYYASTIWQCSDWGLRNYEPSFARGFRNWLRRRYQTIASLNAAWGTKHADFAAIPAPTPEQRRGTQHGLLRDPVAERAVVDFTVYQSVAITDAIKVIARRFKDACQWRKLVYVFYGYTFELAGLQEGISQFGHLDLDGVLDDPSVDVWCAPSGYYDRRNGGSGPIMAPAESCNARGRGWCNEDDLRTHLSAPNAGWGRVQTRDETLWAHRRNVMAALVRRSQMWFMDQAGGWFEDEAIWQNLDVLRRLYEEVYASPAPLQTDVAVVVDEMSLCQVAYGIELGLPLLYDLRAELNRMGTTPELWLQADYLRGRGTPKKLVIFL